MKCFFTYNILIGKNNGPAINLSENEHYAS